MGQGVKGLGTVAAVLAALVVGVAGASAQGPVNAAGACLTPVAADGHEPPCNPQLAGSVWSGSHRSSYAQASSPFPGPAPGDRIRYEHTPAVLGAPIVTDFTEPYADGGRAVWFSTVASPDGRYVYKADFSTGKIIDQRGAINEGSLPGLAGGVSGAYNILDADNHLIVGRGTGFDVYGDSVKGARFSKIALLARFTLPASALCGPDDKLVGAAMLWDGRVAFATQLGVVGTVPRQPARMNAQEVRTLSINGARCAGAKGTDTSLDQVSNSIAADENGGIYVVTSKAQYKFVATGDRLRQEWRAAYQTGTGGGVRLGDGSGSTPTLMGTDPRDDRFVVITDGQDLMHLVLMWRDAIPADWKGLPGRDRRIACETPVTFGDPAALSSSSEQSVLVRGNAAVVVNNKLKNEVQLNALPPQARIIAAPLAGQDPANAPYGLERFDWDPAHRTCSTRWVNRQISIPNGIPSMSTVTNLIYGIAQKNGMFGLAGLDFTTGAERLFVPSSARPDDNSFYAATTVAPDGAVWTGTFTGYTIFRPPPKPGPAYACKDLTAPVARVRTTGSRDVPVTRLNRAGALVSGPAYDRACGELSRTTLARVEVAVARQTRQGCLPLGLSGRLATRTVPCAAPRWLPARLIAGGRRYVLRTVGRLPAGRYRVQARATDQAGNVGPAADHRVLRLRIR